MTSEHGATRGTRATSLTPEMTLTNQGPSPLENNKKSALDVKMARGKEMAKAGNIPDSSNNQNSNASMAVRVAGVIRGGVTPQNHTKVLNERVPPSIERMGGPNTRNPQICTPQSSRIDDHQWKMPWLHDFGSQKRVKKTGEIYHWSSRIYEGNMCKKAQNRIPVFTRAPNNFTVPNRNWKSG